jgi:hypothetical protein
MAVKMLFIVFWIVMLCSLGGGYKRFEAVYHLYLYHKAAFYHHNLLEHKASTFRVENGGDTYL